jgi:hypothetical protein
MNKISYILKYIIMIMIFFIIIKSISKSKCSNMILLNIIMVGIIVHYLFNILNKKNNIREKFDLDDRLFNSNLKYLDENDGEAEESDEDDFDSHIKKKERELKLKELEMRERELKDKEWNEVKRKEKEMRERELEEKEMREKESEIIKKMEKEMPKKDHIYGCNKRKVKNSIWGENYDNDLEFNELPEDMMEPLGKIDTSYSYMPPWKWWPPRKNPPLCSREAKCSPCPITTMGTPTDVKEWDSSRYVTPGLGINIPYIEKLNRQYNEKIN